MAQERRPPKWACMVPRGAEQIKPYNIKPNDEIKCIFPCVMGPGLRTHFCNGTMTLLRYRDLVSWYRRNCTNCSQKIGQGTQFVAVCQNHNHTSGESNIICCRCLELYSKYNLRNVQGPQNGIESRQGPTWYINKDVLYRQYK